ncbi:MAG: CUAEP/CCAEP-tail radical SAM (seleno)protein [Vicinamibacterales bacterium]
MTRVLLISTYDLGRQPFGLASPAAQLRRAGHAVDCVDTTRTKLSEGLVGRAALIAFYLPMHTATRLALPLVGRIRQINPAARLCAYGLYAPLNETLLRDAGVETILGPEFEADLVRLAGHAQTGAKIRAAEADDDAAFRPSSDFRVTFIPPDRSTLPPLSRYAALQIGEVRKIVGYTEATRGCKHRCRHCPIVPVYDGRFRAVPIDVVMADIAAQVTAGAEHITFGDPDFLNGPTHALAIVERLAREHPGITYDATIKVEHLKRHAPVLPVLRDTGCAFVTSAFESFDNRVLGYLDKGHTHRDIEEVVERCVSIGLPLSPTFVAFTPWTSLESYCAMLTRIDALGLVPAVAPIQYALRLLVPQGSRMLELADIRARVVRFDSVSLTHVWEHADPRVDALQHETEAAVGQRLNRAREGVFAHVWGSAHASAGRAAPTRRPLVSRAAIPYLNEPWYC